jgi:hypothetical protein
MRADGRWEVADTAAVRAEVDRHRLARRAGSEGPLGPDGRPGPSDPFDLDRPFDLAVPGETGADDDRRRAVHDAHAEAGATWWIEAVHPWRFGWSEGDPWPLDRMHERIAAGP